MSSEKEARSFKEEADKKAAYTGWFGGNKQEEAAELYCKAANSFKMLKSWKESGDCYMLQAACCAKINEIDEAATAYMNAAKSYKKTHPQESITAMENAVDILKSKGRMAIAANNQKQIAEMYEVDMNNPHKALDAYELAADWYSGEDSNAQAHQCWLKVGALAAHLEDYEKAIDKFEMVARASVDNALTKWSVREYLFKAGLCILATNDIIRAKQSIERYLNLDITFSTTREYKLLAELVQAIENNDATSFTDALVDFDKLSKLDQWKTTLLLRVKKTLATDEVDLT